MAVTATADTAPLTVTPSKVRYGVPLKGKAQGVQWVSLSLQRSQQNTDGTWVDDPRPDSAKIVGFTPTSAAIGAIAALIPSLLSRLGITAPAATYQLKITNSLLAGGAMNLALNIQAICGGQSKAKSIPSLTVFLTANPDLYAPVMSAWAALDSEINTANSDKRWL